MLDIEIRRSEDYRAEEMEQMNEIWRKAYANEPNHDDIEWSHSDWIAVGRVDGRIVSLVCLLEREGQVGECRVRMGGVGGVGTHPEFQRRGYAGKLMEAAAVFLRETMRVPYALLVCEPYRMDFYARYGWQRLEAPMVFHQRGQKRRWESQVMTLALGETPWPAGDVDLLGSPW